MNLQVHIGEMFSGYNFKQQVKQEFKPETLKLPNAQWILMILPVEIYCFYRANVLSLD